MDLLRVNKQPSVARALGKLNVGVDPDVFGTCAVRSCSQLLLLLLLLQSVVVAAAVTVKLFCCYLPYMVGEPCFSTASIVKARINVLFCRPKHPFLARKYSPYKHVFTSRHVAAIEFEGCTEQLLYILGGVSDAYSETGLLRITCP